MLTITYQVKNSVYVNLTNRCPCSCTFCLRNNGSGVFGSNSLWLEREPSLEEVMASLDGWDYSRFREVVFCGYGEPTERLDVLLAAADHLKFRDKNLRIRVNTNGLSDLINGKPTASLFAGRIDCISISLNTDDASEYLAVCRPKFGEAAYPAMLKFAGEAAKVVPEVVLTIVEEPITDAEKQMRCRAIAEKLGAKLRIRPYEPHASQSTTEKLERLRSLLQDMGSVVVAFSGGVDSTFLLHVANSTLGDRAMAATIRSHMIPDREVKESVDFCRARGIRQKILEIDELEIPNFTDNPPDRCYHCKKALFEKILNFAKDNGFAAVAEGANRDDDGDFRPGHRAVRELGVRSPLHEAGFTKDEIRALSREMGLPTWNRPSFACLASRFPYGERITPAALTRVERAEQWLMDAGLDLTQIRVRAHGDLARIEVQKDAIARIAAHADEINAAFKSFGFAYTTLDLRGYRTGSMNEVLKNEDL